MFTAIAISKRKEGDIHAIDDLQQLRYHESLVHAEEVIY